MSENMSKNPIVDYMYTADPAPMVWGDTVAEFRYNEDGSIDTVEKCEGVKGI